jgi:Mn2+/Fe2+ NRAMP family transporter
VGARFGTELAWVVLCAHLFKYAAFEAGPRFTAATGETLLEGYARLPGPRNWALWMGLGDMVLESVGVLAAVVGLTASFLHGAFGGPGLPAWSLGVAGLAGLLVWTGGYRALAKLNLGMLAVLAVGTAVAFAAEPPELGAAAAGLVPAGLPAGSIVIVAAVLGWMPTGVGVSVWHSLWTERALAGSEALPPRRVRWACRDMARGYLFSGVLALLFLYLGASVLRPAGVVLAEQTDVALQLARLYESAAPWMGRLFLVVAFCGMFGTCYAAMDGFPRTLVATVDLLRGAPRCRAPERRKLYRLYLLAGTAGGLSVLALVPDPVRLVQWLGAVTLLFTPIYAALNHYCVHRLVPDPALRPGPALRALSIAGVLFLAASAALLVSVTAGWTTGTSP